MKTYEAFHITRFEWDEKNYSAKFYFQFDDDVKFCEEIVFPATKNKFDSKAFRRSLEVLHIALGVSYYKAYVPKNIVVHSENFSAQKKEFFTTMYQKGLGEFWFKNQIDWQSKIQFTAPYENDAKKSEVWNGEIQQSTFENPLVPIGGGKDSAVTISLLQKAGITPTLFRVGEHPLITKQADITKCPLLTVERILDVKLQDCNANGAYNGHIPVTAIVSCIAISTAILHNHDAVIFSNESSASEGNVLWNNLDVNHQWSKSFECETLLRKLLQSDIAENIHYFSLLRPLTEVAIVRHFARLPELYFCTTSSNSNWRIWKEKPTSLWGEDEKSAFVFALYLTALEEDTVLEIFDNNLFRKPKLLDTYRELLGLKDIKPFECVGTPEEMQYAFLYCLENGKMLHTEAMDMFKNEALLNTPSINDLEEKLFSLQQEHYVPEKLLSLLSYENTSA